MARFDFYVKCLLIAVISAAFVLFEDSGAGMRKHVTWAVTSLLAYLFWAPWTVLPESWLAGIKSRLWRKSPRLTDTAP